MGLENCDEMDMAQIGQEVRTPVRAQGTSKCKCLEGNGSHT
jgi:hypothetical protein